MGIRYLFLLLLLSGCATVNSDFSWQDHTEGSRDLLYQGKTLLRYMHQYDPSSTETLHATYKPYHHVFDATGERLLTKGPGGLYTHHRGIFIGWNRLTVDGQENDWWHMKGVAQQHRAILEETAGEDQARTCHRIDWTNEEGETVLREERTLTIHTPPASVHLLLDFSTRLTAMNSEVFLNGDPEHGGFQFRPHNGVAEGDATVKAAYLFHKPEIDPKQDHDLPWVAMCFGLDQDFYTVQHMNHPDNPSPTVYSAYRDYGRFGAFFTRKIPAGETLGLRYRICITQGKMLPRETLAARFQNFVEGL